MSETTTPPVEPTETVLRVSVTLRQLEDLCERLVQLADDGEELDELQQVCDEFYLGVAPLGDDDDGEGDRIIQQLHTEEDVAKWVVAVTASEGAK